MTQFIKNSYKEPKKEGSKGDSFWGGEGGDLKNVDNSQKCRKYYSLG